MSHVITSLGDHRCGLCGRKIDHDRQHFARRSVRGPNHAEARIIARYHMKCVQPDHVCCSVAQAELDEFYLAWKRERTLG